MGGGATFVGKVYAGWNIKNCALPDGKQMITR